MEFYICQSNCRFIAFYQVVKVEFCLKHYFTCTYLTLFVSTLGHFFVHSKNISYKAYFVVETFYLLYYF